MKWKASGFFHLHSSEPLFNQLVALGGSPIIQPIPQGVAEIAYGIVTSALGLDKLSPADQVKALLDIPAEELASKLAKVGYPLAAVIDDDVVKTPTTYTGLANTDALETIFPGIKWCKTIMMGDCQFDGMIMDLTALGHRTDNLCATLKKCLETVFPDDSAKVTAIVEGYGIDESAADKKTPVLYFLNDIGFAQGAKATAQAWTAAGSRLGTKAYLEHFNLPNPWPGAYQGHASHALDAAIVLGNYNNFLGAGQRACAEKMTGDLISLAYSKEPFAPYSNGLSMVYYASANDDEDGSGSVSDADGSKTGRRRILDQIAAGQPEVLDKLLGAFGLLVQGPK